MMRGVLIGKALMTLAACRKTSGNFGLGAWCKTAAGGNKYHLNNQEDQVTKISRREICAEGTRHLH